MATKQTNGHCAQCQQPRLFQKQKMNHVLHLVLTIITLGLWSIVWIILGISSSSKPMLCTVCGGPPGLTWVEAAPERNAPQTTGPPARGPADEAT